MRLHALSAYLVAKELRRAAGRVAGLLDESSLEKVYLRVAAALEAKEMIVIYSGPLDREEEQEQ